MFFRFLQWHVVQRYQFGDVINSRSLYVGISMLRTGRGGGVGTGIGAAFEHFLCPVRIFYHIWTLFQAQGSEMWPKKMPKICVYIYQMLHLHCMPILFTLPVHTLIPAFMQYIVFTPLPLTPPTSTDQNHPTPPHTEINQVPRRFRKIRGKKNVLDKE